MKKILVIDDNTDIRENTAEILSLSGYQVYTAENGKRGVEKALAEIPDLIVCDIMMPELDGYGVLHLLKKNVPTENIPFIFLTAKTERTDLRKGMELGADDYITKPFDDLELLRAVEIRLKKMEVIKAQYAVGNEGANKMLNELQKSGTNTLNPENYDSNLFQKKMEIYAEGKRPKFVYYVKAGKVKTFRLHENGKEYITNLYNKGDYFGYLAAMENSNYAETAEVLEEAELAMIPKDDFLQGLYSDLSIAKEFIKLISRDVQEKEERLLHLAYDSLRKRVAKGIVAIAQKFGTEKVQAGMEISREDLAQYVGTATESLIRTLSDFKSEKLIEIKEGKIKIPQLQKLIDLAY